MNGREDQIIIGLHIEMEGSILFGLYPPGLTEWGQYLVRIMKLSGQTQGVAIDCDSYAGEFIKGTMVFKADQPAALQIIADELRGLGILDCCTLATVTNGQWTIHHSPGSQVNFQRYMTHATTPQKPRFLDLVFGMLLGVHRASVLHVRQRIEWKAFERAKAEK